MIKIINMLLREEKGQALIMMAFAIAALLGITAFTVDYGLLFSQKRHMQNVADAASIAGAWELPNASYEQVVKDYVEANGLDPENDIETILLSDDNLAVTVILKQNRGLYFAHMLGFQNADIAAKAKAGRMMIYNPWYASEVFGKYTLFSELKTEIKGSNITIYGAAHSNGSVDLSSTTYDYISAVNSVKVQPPSYYDASKIKVPVDPIDFPYFFNAVPPEVNPADYPKPVGEYTIPSMAFDLATLYLLADEKYSGEKTYGSNLNIGHGNIIFVDGNVKLQGSSVSGVGIIVATGDIQLSGSSITLSSSDDAIVLYAGGDIKMSSSVKTVEGMLYAPSGDISLPGADSTVKGSIIGKTIGGTGSGGANKALGDDKAWEKISQTEFWGTPEYSAVMLLQ